LTDQSDDELNISYRWNKSFSSKSTFRFISVQNAFESFNYLCNWSRNWVNDSVLPTYLVSHILRNWVL